MVQIMALHPRSDELLSWLTTASLDICFNELNISSKKRQDNVYEEGEYSSTWQV